MPNFSSLFTQLTGAGFYYFRSPRHATRTFNQDGRGMYRNQPRMPFEFYVAIELDKSYSVTNKFFDSIYKKGEFEQVTPLIKSVDMPGMKIETTPINQYNRIRLSQTKIKYDPVNIVFHDVADGKTLKFWELYYRFYFLDGREPGVNSNKSENAAQGGICSFEDIAKNTISSKLNGLKDKLMPKFNPDLVSLPSSIKKLFGDDKSNADENPATNTNGAKGTIQNIVSDKLDNHNFGYNLTNVQNNRNLIKTIQIFQVHGGKFNKVTLVNPRITAFKHDTLAYDKDELVAITMTFEYEYAFYEIKNESLDTDGKEVFKNGDILELPSLAFVGVLDEFMEENNPLLKSDNPIIQKFGKNVQSSISSVANATVGGLTRKASASVLHGMSNVSTGINSAIGTSAAVSTRSFTSTAPKNTTQYVDVNRSNKK